MLAHWAAPKGGAVGAVERDELGSVEGVAAGSTKGVGTVSSFEEVGAVGST